MTYFAQALSTDGTVNLKDLIVKAEITKIEKNNTLYSNLTYNSTDKNI